MPPKAKAQTGQPSKKNEQKKKEKIIEDKTFGMKNKKGAKQQKLIQQIEKQVKFGGSVATRKLEEAKRIEREKKEKEKKEQKELNEIFRPVAKKQELEKGVDPKSVLCAFYKQGACMKGNKCKFSHDIAVERKSEKRSLYVDLRDDMEQEISDTVDELKYTGRDKNKPKTAKVCSHFLDAVQNNTYGWFWKCPNEPKCIFRHALPPGFVLKKDMRKEERQQISLEDLIEKERAALGANLTKITLETFLSWKKRKLKEKETRVEEEKKKKKDDFKAGRLYGLSGRDMFIFSPEMAATDQCEEGGETVDVRNMDQEGEEEEDVDDANVRDVDLHSFVAEEQDGSGTQVLKRSNLHCAEMNGEVGTSEISKLEEATGGIPIDENLFGDDDDDLNELEETLDSLDIDQWHSS